MRRLPRGESIADDSSIINDSDISSPVDDDEDDELEDNFVSLAMEGEEVLQEEDPKNETEIFDCFNREIKEVKGNQISDEAFRKIIAEDRKLLNLPERKKNEEVEEIKEIKEEKETNSEPKHVDPEVAAFLDPNYIPPKRTNKHVEVEKEDTQILPGGGKLVIRKLKKVDESCTRWASSERRSAAGYDDENDDCDDDYDDYDDYDKYQDEWR